MADLTTSRADETTAGRSSPWDELAHVVDKAIGKFSRMTIVDRSELAVLFERDHLRKLLTELEVDCVFDVGANVGQYARMLRQKAKYKGRIISFEPLVNEFEKLKDASKADALWDVERAGITSNGGTRTFKVMRASQFSSFAEPTSRDTDKFAAATTILQRASIETLTLRTVYERYHRRYGFQRPFLKLDTQGLRHVEILTGSASILQKFVGFRASSPSRRFMRHPRTSDGQSQSIRIWDSSLAHWSPTTSGTSRP